MTQSKPSWILYLLVSSVEKRTYVGITVDLARRIRQHNGEIPGGAKATRRGRPWIVQQNLGTFSERGAAQAAEAAFKRLNAEKRLQFSQKKI